jgi:hypothetical protein
MKKFQKSRNNERFPLTTPQNPTLELGSLSQMLAVMEKRVEQGDPSTRVIFSADGQKQSSAAGVGAQLPGNPPELPSAIEVSPLISNRHSGRLEIAATDSKQTTAPISNRHFFAPVARKIRALFQLQCRGKLDDALQSRPVSSAVFLGHLHLAAWE